MLHLVASITDPSFQSPVAVCVNPSAGHIVITNTVAHSLSWSIIGSNSYDTVGMFGTNNTQEGMATPSAVALDGQGNMYVLDTGNGEIDHYTFDNVASAYNYNSGFLGGDRSTFAGKSLQFPSDLVYKSGSLFVLDAGNSRVVEIDLTSGSATEVLSDNTLIDPASLAVGSGGELYVADSGQHSVIKYLQGTKAQIIGAYGTTDGQLRQPGGVALGPTGDIYIADTGNQRLQVFSASGSHRASIKKHSFFGSLSKISVENGTIYVADPGRNSIHIFDTSTQGPILESDKELLEFGTIEQGLSLRLSITLRNLGSSPLQVNSISSSNNAFVPESANFSIPANDEAQLIVRFSPTDTRYYSGNLIVDSSSLVGKVHTILMRGFGAPARPVDTVLVLDRSGSMRQDAGGQSKMDLLKQASMLFIDLMRAGEGDRLGVVSYSDQATTEHNFEPVTVSPVDSRSAMKAAVNNIHRGGNTSIGAGVLAARAQLPTGQQDSARKCVIVVSDGMENRPPYIAPKHESDPSVDLSQLEDLNIYTIGLGLGLEVDLHVLNKLATLGEKGRFHLTETDWLNLQKFFVEIYADAAGEFVAFDPQFTAVGTIPVEIEVPFGDVDHAASFVVSWADPYQNLSLHLVTPDGYEIHPGNAYHNTGIDFHRGETYAFFRISLPIVFQQRSAHKGRWKAIVQGKLQEGIHVPFEFSVIVRSDLGISCKLERDGNRTGQAVTLEVETTFAGQPVAPNNIEVTLEGPQHRRGEVLSSVDVEVKKGEIDPDYGTHTIRRQLAAAVKEDKRLRERKNYKIELEQYGASETPFFRAQTPSLELEGHYQSRFVAEIEMDGILLRRECRHSFALVAYPSLENTEIIINEIKRTENAAHIGIEVILRDHAGNLIGPGESLSASLSGSGSEIGRFRDIGDGSYHTEAQIPFNRDRVTIHLADEVIPRVIPRFERRLTGRIFGRLIDRLMNRRDWGYDPDMSFYEEIFLTIRVREAVLTYPVLRVLRGERVLPNTGTILGGGYEIQ